jgi:nudix-type nucleoside diphosphatase (YffH/AdpP family)
MNIPEIKIKTIQLLSDNYYILKNIIFNYRRLTDDWIEQSREVYNRGDGTAILLYNIQQQTIILTRQFRLPTYLNGNKTGMLVEVCAGCMEDDSPEACIIRETEEETGYRITQVTKVMETYTSPGAVTEILHLFVAQYDASMKVNQGGGLAHEHEDIQVFEILFEDAYQMIASGEIKDAKTIMLLQYAKINQLV